MLRDKKTQPTVFRDIILTDSIRRAGVFVVVSVTCDGVLALIGLQPRSLSRSRRSRIPGRRRPKWRLSTVGRPETIDSCPVKRGWHIYSSPKGANMMTWRARADRVENRAPVSPRATESKTFGRSGKT